MLFVVTFDYAIFYTLAIPLYLLSLVLLGIVLIVGQTTYGAQRWIDLGVFPLQPSEPAKLALILVLARYWADHQERVQNLPTVAASLILLGIPVAVTFIQPDLGTSVIFVAVWLGMAVMAGVRFLHLLFLALLAALAIPLLWQAMYDYMRSRLMVFFNPTVDPLGAGYNIRQALISVGSGGLLGKGFTNGTQTQLDFLRVQHTDFIFSALAEELGFIGAMALLVLLFLLVLRMTRIAGLAKDSFGRLVATGVAVTIASQAFINIGMNIQMLPAVGIPLPFISYGGSSLITLLIAIGLLQSIVMRYKKWEF